MLFLRSFSILLALYTLNNFSLLFLVQILSLLNLIESNLFNIFPLYLNIDNCMVEFLKHLSTSFHILPLQNNAHILSFYSPNSYIIFTSGAVANISLSRIVFGTTLFLFSTKLAQALFIMVLFSTFSFFIK